MNIGVVGTGYVGLVVGACLAENGNFVVCVDNDAAKVKRLRQGEIPGTGQLDRILFNEKMEELRREQLLTDLHQRIRDVKQGPDGLLYVLTDEAQGAVLRIEPR